MSAQNFVYKYQEVRDLAWICFSPPMLSELPGLEGLSHPALVAPSKTSDRQSLFQQWLKELDNNPQPLLLHLDNLKSPRLGIYYEALFGFFCANFPNHRLVCQNLQVSDQGRTLGEFDLIAEMQGRSFHIETAVKFYLGVPEKSLPSNDTTTTSSWQQWIGPNCNDRLDKKLFRLRDHQLRLSDTPAGKQALHNRKIHTESLHKALQLQGYLFYPAHTSMSPPAHSHSNHLRGHWYYLKDFLERLKKENKAENKQKEKNRWLALEKRHWLSNATISDETLQQKGGENHHNASLDRTNHTENKAHPLQPTLMAEHLKAAFHIEDNEERGKNERRRKRPLLLARMEHKNTYWQEQERCFIVPDYWPWTTTPSRKT